MSTNDTTTPSKMQSHLQTMVTGLTNSTYALLSSLVILGSSLSKAEIIAKLNGWLALYTAVVQAKQTYVTAMVARKAAQATMVSFYAALVAAVKQAVGPTNASLLGAMGIEPTAARKQPTAEAKAAAQVKAKATRQARGTMGKVQRMKVTTSSNPQTPTVASPTTSSSTAATPVPTASSNTNSTQTS